MRFVRLAHTFTEQNMLLEETEDNRLFFRCSQLIAPKQEIKVGYSREYADRYGLWFLEPSAEELRALNERWSCFECNEKFESSEKLQTHLREHDKRKHTRNKRGVTGTGRKRRRPNHSRLSTRKVSGPTVRYACCFCSQVFSKLVAFRRHNEAEHQDMDAEPRVGAASSSVLQNSNKDNRAQANRCEQCQRSFPSVERFEVSSNEKFIIIIGIGL